MDALAVEACEVVDVEELRFAHIQGTRIYISSVMWEPEKSPPLILAEPSDYRVPCIANISVGVCIMILVDRDRCEEETIEPVVLVEPSRE